MSSSFTGVDTAVLSFDASGTEFATALPDGRVRLFNVSEQKLIGDITQSLVSRAAADVPQIYSCMAWGEAAFGKQAARLLFLGSTSGTVRCYDSSVAELKWEVGELVDGPIAAIGTAHGTSSSGVVVAGQHGGIAILDPLSGNVVSTWQASKQQLSRIATASNGTVVLAGMTLSLHDATTGARICKWNGHSSPVIALATDDDASIICSAAKSDRSVAIWSSLKGSNGKLKHKHAVARLDCDEQPVHISLFTNYQELCTYITLILSTGTVQIYEFSKASNKTRLRAQSQGIGGTALASLLLAGDANGVHLVLAKKSALKPIFQSQRVEFTGVDDVAEFAIDREGDAGIQNLVNNVSKSRESQKASVSKKGVKVIGVEESVAVLGRTTGSKRGFETEKGVVPLDDENEEDLMDIVNEEEEEEEEEREEEEEEGGAEPTLGERVAALQVNRSHAEHQDAHPAQDREAGGAGPIPPLKADSLSVLLSQAVQSNDTYLIEQCLAVRSEEIIVKTIKRLSPVDALGFFQIAVGKLRSTPSRAEVLLVWIRAILLHHTAYLTSSSTARETMSFLYQTIEARLASHQALLSLSGRLDLILANAAQRMDEEPLQEAPLVALHVGSDGELEEEDAFAIDEVANEGESLGSEGEDEDEDEMFDY